MEAAGVLSNLLHLKNHPAFYSSTNSNFAIFGFIKSLIELY